MKFAKMIGLLAVASAALMAYAGSALATTMEAPEGTPYTGTFSETNEGGVTLHGVVDVTCNKASLSGKIESHGVGVTAKGPIETLSISECNQHVKVIKTGTVEFHHISGSGTRAKKTSSGAEVTVEFTTIFGSVHCVFATSNTELGEFTPAPSASGHATFHTDSAPIPVKSGSGLCGSSAELTGTFKFHVPTGFKSNT